MIIPLPTRAPAPETSQQAQVRVDFLMLELVELERQRHGMDPRFYRCDAEAELAQLQRKWACVPSAGVCAYACEIAKQIQATREWGRAQADCEGRQGRLFA